MLLSLRKNGLTSLFKEVRVFKEGEGMLSQKHRERNGRCTAILFTSIGVRGRFDSPMKPENAHARGLELPLEGLRFCILMSAQNDCALSSV